MKRRQKRYTTEAEIIKDIDLAKQRRDELIREANECGDRLKNCLAAFRTGLLEAITTDPAVVK